MGGPVIAVPCRSVYCIPALAGMTPVGSAFPRHHVIPAQAGAQATVPQRAARELTALGIELLWFGEVALASIRAINLGRSHDQVASHISHVIRPLAIPRNFQPKNVGVRLNTTRLQRQKHLTFFRPEDLDRERGNQWMEL